MVNKDFQKKHFLQTSMCNAHAAIQSCSSANRANHVVIVDQIRRQRI